MNSAPLNEQRSPKRTVLPQMHICEHIVENGRFRNQNMREIGPKKIVIS